MNTSPLIVRGQPSYVKKVSILSLTGLPLFPSEYEDQSIFGFGYYKSPLTK